MYSGISVMNTEFMAIYCLKSSGRHDSAVADVFSKFLGNLHAESLARIAFEVSVCDETEHQHCDGREEQPGRGHSVWEEKIGARDAEVGAKEG